MDEFMMGTNSAPARQLEYVNAAKVLFILLVMLQHLPEYLGYNVLAALRFKALSEHTGGLGVSGFVILSAFGAVGVPVFFGLSYGIQVAYDQIPARLLTRIRTARS